MLVVVGVDGLSHFNQLAAPVTRSGGCPATVAADKPLMVFTIRAQPGAAIASEVTLGPTALTIFLRHDLSLQVEISDLMGSPMQGDFARTDLRQELSGVLWIPGIDLFVPSVDPGLAVREITDVLGGRLVDVGVLHQAHRMKDGVHGILQAILAAERTPALALFTIAAIDRLFHEGSPLLITHVLFPLRTVSEDNGVKLPYFGDVPVERKSIQQKQTGVLGEQLLVVAWVVDQCLTAIEQVHPGRFLEQGVNGHRSLLKEMSSSSTISYEQGKVNEESAVVGDTHR